MVCIWKITKEKNQTTNYHAHAKNDSFKMNEKWNEKMTPNIRGLTLMLVAQKQRERDAFFALTCVSVNVCRLCGAQNTTEIINYLNWKSIIWKWNQMVKLCRFCLYEECEWVVIVMFLFLLLFLSLVVVYCIRTKMKSIVYGLLGIHLMNKIFGETFSK